MLNSRTFYNSRPDGFAVLEVVDPDPKPNAPRQFVPLRRTDLAGREAEDFIARWSATA